MKSKKCIFLGYCDGSKGYRLIEMGTKKIVNSRDVIFFEKPKKLDIIDPKEQALNVFIPLTDPDEDNRRDASDPDGDNAEEDNFDQSNANIVADNIAETEEKEFPDDPSETVEVSTPRRSSRKPALRKFEDDIT